MRLTKYLAQNGFCSRREAEMFIRRGWLEVDGEKVTRLNAEVDQTSHIDMLPALINYQNQLVTILLHKPLGYVSGQPEKGCRPAASLLVKERRYGSKSRKIKWPLKRLAPAGRLDIDSSGLLVFSQDGRVARQLISPESTVEKEYLVRVNRRVRPKQIDRLTFGLKLDDVQLKEAQVKQIDANFLQIILTQGRKRQIRRMCGLVGLQVTSLKRVRIGNVRLGSLPSGHWRLLGKNEKF